jgi:N utilization substance protein A
MSKALIAGITQVANEKGLDREVIFEAIEAALISAYKRNYGSVANVTAEVDRVTGEMNILAEREVVEDVISERTEIAEKEAKKINPNAELGDVIQVKTNPDDFGRIAAQTAKQVILQRIREAERDTVYENFAHRVGELINAQVRSVDLVSGTVTVLLDDKHESLLMRDEQIPRERLRRGDYVRVYIVDVHKSSRGPVIKLSRTHRNLLRRLLEQEIPEVRDGVVEIKAIAREPGARSKTAVVATREGVDAVGSCVGLRGLRIQNIVNELSGEKIDVVEWHPELTKYIANALSPAKVNNVILEEKGNVKTAIVIVPDRQLSLAIGKEGQNARLAAKLTGWRIDIKSESEAIEEGLDRLAQAQLQATMGMSPAEDLLTVAERLLQGDDVMDLPAVTEDKLSEAARALEKMAEQESISPPIELPSLDDVLAKLEEQDRYGTQMEIPDLPDVMDIPEMPVLPDEEAYTIRTETEAAETEDADEELPEVITADMLRAAMSQRKKIEDEDFEIPAELLVGLEEDVPEEKEEDLKTLVKEEEKKKKKSSKKKGKRKRRPSYQDEDDYRNYF